MQEEQSNLLRGWSLPEGGVIHVGHGDQCDTIGYGDQCDTIGHGDWSV